MSQAILNLLSIQLEKIQNTIELREEKFSEKSEKYQESEKGELYETKTYQLQECADDLERAIDSLYNYLERH